jgi:hypothetical protein
MHFRTLAGHARWWYNGELAKNLSPTCLPPLLLARPHRPLLLLAYWHVSINTLTCGRYIYYTKAKEWAIESNWTREWMGWCGSLGGIVFLFNRLSPTLLPRISRNERRMKAAGDPLIHNNTPSIRADIDRKAIAARHITSSVRTHSKTTSVYSQPWLYRNRQHSEQQWIRLCFVCSLHYIRFDTATAVGVIYTPSIYAVRPLSDICIHRTRHFSVYRGFKGFLIRNPAQQRTFLYPASVYFISSQYLYPLDSAASRHFLIQELHYSNKLLDDGFRLHTRRHNLIYVTSNRPQCHIAFGWMRWKVVAASLL